MFITEILLLTFHCDQKYGIPYYLIKGPWVLIFSGLSTAGIIRGLVSMSEVHKS